MLLRDPNFQDSYWELKVEDRYVSKCGTGGRWVMREKAEQEHGGGITGRTAIENGIKAGIFEERFIECGDGTQVSQVKIVEDYEETSRSREVSAAKKARTGGTVTKAMLHDKMDELISGAGPSTEIVSGAGPSTAINSGAGPSTASISGAGPSKKPARVLAIERRRATLAPARASRSALRSPAMRRSLARSITPALVVMGSTRSRQVH